MLNAEEIVQTYSSMVYKIAYRYVSDPTDAEDVYSETFLNYFKKDREFESEEHRKAWLIKVTINCAKELLGSRTYDAELNEEIAGGEDFSAPSDEVLALREAIGKLPEKQREVVCLFYLQDLPVRQIAEMLDMNENTVKVTLSRAREKLRTYLEG